jgi:hypothetical protein
MRRTEQVNDIVPGQDMHVEFTVKLYTGDLEYTTAHDHAPIKMVPPYGHTSSIEQMDHGTVAHVSVCDISHAVPYLALRGGQHCAMYEVSVQVYTSNERSCAPQAHTGGAEAHFEVEELQFDHSVVRSCTAGGYVDFYVNILNQAGRTKPGVNLVVEIEDLSNDLDTAALALHLYEGEIPADRETKCGGTTQATVCTA